MPAALPDPSKKPGKRSPLQKLTEAAPRAFNMILSMLTIFDLFALSLVSEKWKRLVHAYHTAVPDNAVQSIRMIATTKTEKISITRNKEDKEFWIWEFDSSFNFFRSVFSPSVPVLESLICWKEETEDDAEANGTITRHTLKVRTAEWKAIEKLLEHLFSIFEFRSKIIYFDLDWQSFGIIGFLDSMKQHGFDTYSYQGRNEVEWANHVQAHQPFGCQVRTKRPLLPPIDKASNAWSVLTTPTLSIVNKSPGCDFVPYLEMNVFTRCMPRAFPNLRANPRKPLPLDKLAKNAPRALNIIMSMLTIFDLFAHSLLSKKWKKLVKAFHSEKPDNAPQSIQLIANYEKREISIVEKAEDPASWVFVLDSSTGLYERLYASIPVLENISCWEWRAEVENVNKTGYRYVLKLNVTVMTAIGSFFKHLLFIFSPNSKKVQLQLDLAEEFDVIEFLDFIRAHQIDSYTFSSKNEVDEILTTVLTKHPQSKELLIDCVTSSEFSFKIKHLKVDNHFHSKKSRGTSCEELLQLMSKGTKEICLYQTSFNSLAFRVLVLTTRTAEKPQWKKITLQLCEEINILSCFETVSRLPALNSTDKRAIGEPLTLYTFSTPGNNASNSSEITGFHIKKTDDLILTITLFNRCYACIYLQDSEAEFLKIITTLDHTLIR
ncbi:unnamed protein product [Caenorhabditis brenneri]